MKTKRLYKSTVSLLLVFMMLMSMLTVGIVNAGAAEADVAEIAAGTTVYFQNNWKWTDVRIHVYNSSDAALTGSWPGAAMTKVGTSGDYDYYKYTLPTNAFGFVFNGIKNDGSGARDQSPDIETIPTNDHFYYMNWNNGNECPQANESITVKFPSEGGTTDPTEPPTTDPDDPVNTTTICFRDDASEAIDTADADMYVQFSGGDKVKMTKTVDTMSGHDMWYADMPETATSVKFIRASVIDKAEWNTWSPSLSGNTTGLYRATGWGTGSWGTPTEYHDIPDKEDINNYSFGIWADTKGNGNLYDLVIARKLSSSEFHLYLPSNTPNPVKLYTSFASLTIGSTKVSDGTAVTLNAGSSYSMNYKQTQYDTSNKTATLKVYKTTDTAALLFQTKRDLYTGTVGTLSVSGYKDGIQTKGSYYLYDEAGNLVNSDAVLKKIKGRGNSSFEASMRVYGKYAYNFNLDKKVALIDGATAAKKWCLLANNVDHTMMRNTFIYALADDIGIKYSPETRLVDVYDNGYYLGAYVITEKVEYGKNTMMSDMKNLDDGNEDANIAYYNNEDIMDVLEGHLIQKTSSYTTNGKTYSYQYTTSDDTTNWPYKQPCADLTEDEITDYNYLLEFELHSRYTSEASWFVSPRTNQAVVVKYPEFATQDEMKWIIAQYELAEAAIYNNNTDSIKNLVDVDSFAKMYLLQELSINLDSCATSYYIHNDLTSGKLVASPVWDYDWACGAYAKDLKYVYNGSSVTTSSNMSDPNQMFVKNKALQTDAGSRADGKSWISNYNFQAKLVHNSYVWERCQYFWTNDMAPALYSYLIDDYSDTTDKGTIVTEWLPKFQSSVDMNDARWGAYTKNDDWGTKVTSDYTKGSGLTSSSNFKIGNCSSSGSSSKNFANTVYYLNDWLKTRRDYMSGTGDLWNDELKEEYKIENVTFKGIQDSTDDTKLTITPSATVTMNGEAVAAANTTYTIYVNGKAVYNSNFAEPSHTITLSAATNEVYVVVGVKDTDKSAQSESQTFTIYVPEYMVANVEFKAEQSADEATVTVTPSANVTLDGNEVDAAGKQYTIYLNGTAYVTNTFETVSVEVPLEKGIVNEIYIEVTPVDNTNVSGTSATQKFSYGVEVETVDVTLYLKSSSSARYVPSVTVGKETTKMTKSGDAIGKNASQTQSYYWYKATVAVPVDTATKITFTNSYSMSATATLTVSAENTFYYGVANLNNGTTAVDLTAENETVRNFTQSATCMLQPSSTDPGTAQTSVNGTRMLIGDATADGKTTIDDATAIQLALAEKDTLSDTGKALSDFNFDGVSSIMDATLTQYYIAR